MLNNFQIFFFFVGGTYEKQKPINKMNAEVYLWCWASLMFVTVIRPVGTKPLRACWVFPTSWGCVDTQAHISICMAPICHSTAGEDIHLDTITLTNNDMWNHARTHSNTREHQKSLMLGVEIPLPSYSATDDRGDKCMGRSSCTCNIKYVLAFVWTTLNMTSVKSRYFLETWNDWKGHF